MPTFELGFACVLETTGNIIFPYTFLPLLQHLVHQAEQNWLHGE